MPIKTIIFDLGNVLVQDTVKALQDQYNYNRLSKAQKHKFRGALEKSETGKLPTREFLQALQGTLAKNKALRDINQFIIEAPLQPPWKLLQQLKKHYRVIIFSNNQRAWIKQISKHLKVNFYEVPVVNSAVVGLRKPDVKFYRHVTEKYRLAPEEIVFIDDSRQNLAPAKKLGWHTFLYQDNYPKLVSHLKKLGVKAS